MTPAPVQPCGEFRFWVLVLDPSTFSAATAVLTAEDAAGSVDWDMMAAHYKLQYEAPLNNAMLTLRLGKTWWRETDEANCANQPRPNSPVCLL